MSTHKHIDRVCCIIMIFTLVVTILFCNADALGVDTADTVIGYENKLFDTSYVHTIDIIMDDWDEFIDGCEDEKYEECAIIIDNEAYKNVAIRAKGNTSLSSVSAYGNDRYSFKIEFDHYDSGRTYYGLDKLSLNNIIQDNTYMKDYLVYQMMAYMGVSSPLCSYVYITVNGEDFGLYLAVEGVEESFLERNYGSSYGELYKPDSTEQGSMDADDIALIYSDDEYDSYTHIFENAKTDITEEDMDRLIASLKKLGNGEDIDSVVDVDSVIKYFVVHNFVCNFDSYTGSMLHNYYLYEEDGVLSMIPWDYNLSFGTFSTGGMGESPTDMGEPQSDMGEPPTDMGEPPTDMGEPQSDMGEPPTDMGEPQSDMDSQATKMVNYPIDNPVSGGAVSERPMLAWIFGDEYYTELYHDYFSQFISEYMDSGCFEELVQSTRKLIEPYVESDPTKFCTYEEFETGVDTLIEFCGLRAKSVSGQLSGDIPSTSEGQSLDDSELIDASDIDISDMGTMENRTKK